MASTDEVHDCGGQVEPTVLTGADRMRASPAGSAQDRAHEREVCSARSTSCCRSPTASWPTRAAGTWPRRATRVAEDRFNLVVLGEFKRGKSTLINALLGRDVLPTGVVPLTSVVTAIGAGDRDRLRRPLRGRPRGGAPARRAGRVRDRGPEPGQPPGRRAGARRARPRAAARRAGAGRHPRDRLDSLLTTRRSPATSSRGSTRRSACSTPASRCRRASASCSSRPPSRVPRLLMVDQQDRPPRPRRPRGGGRVHPLGAARPARRHRARAVRGQRPPPRRARAPRGAPATGSPPRSVTRCCCAPSPGWREASRPTPRRRRGSSRVRSSCRSRSWRLARRMFEQRIAELTAGERRGRRPARPRDRARGRAASSTSRSSEYARREEARLRAALREHVEELGERSPRELSAELEAWIDATVRAEFEQLVPRFEAAIAEQLTELERRYAQPRRADPRAGPGGGRGRVRRARERGPARHRPARPVALLVQAQGRRARARHDRRLRTDDHPRCARSPARDPRRRAAADRHDRPPRRSAALRAGRPRRRQPPASTGASWPRRSTRRSTRSAPRSTARPRIAAAASSTHGRGSISSPGSSGAASSSPSTFASGPSDDIGRT